VQCVLPSRYHSIHKNELARAMFEGTQKALAQLQQKRAQGGALPTPVVKSYEYSDMKPFFNKDDPRTDLAVAKRRTGSATLRIEIPLLSLMFCVIVAAAASSAAGLLRRLERNDYPKQRIVLKSSDFR
jgi:hypothetical protein